jgi:small conductance mechanosensitive channel
MEPWVSNLIRTGVVMLGALVVYLIGVRVGRHGVKRISQRGSESQERAETLWVMIRRLYMVIVLTTSILVIFSVWGISITPFLAVGTVVAAAIGFGAQDIVKDFLAGFFILAEDQFRIGDTVTIAGTTGTVEDIQFRITKLRDLEGNVHIVPNGQIGVASNFTNLFAQPVIDVGISYDSDVDLALSVLKDELDTLANDPDWADRIQGESEILGVNKLDDSAVVLRARLTTTAGDRWAVRREALRRIKNRFDGEGITIPFPQVTIHRAD